MPDKYDLEDKMQLAQFLEKANVRLVPRIIGAKPLSPLLKSERALGSWGTASGHRWPAEVRVEFLQKLHREGRRPRLLTSLLCAFLSLLALNSFRGIAQAGASLGARRPSPPTSGWATGSAPHWPRTRRRVGGGGGGDL